MRFVCCPIVRSISSDGSDCGENNWLLVVVKHHKVLCPMVRVLSSRVMRNCNGKVTMDSVSFARE